MRLNKAHNLIIPKTDLDMSYVIRFLFKLAKFLIKTSINMHKPKTYNEVMNNPIHENK